MLESHNISLHELLASSGLGYGSRWFEPRTELCLLLGFGLVMLLGLLANALVAFTLCRYPRLHSPRHWFLLNLAISDLLTCVLCVPVTVLRLTLKDWRLGEALCRLAPFLQLTYVFVSVFTILAIAVDRYRAIVCSPHLTPHERQRVARLLLPVLWLLALGLATPLAVNHRLEHVHNVTGDTVLMTLCVEHWASDTTLGVYTLVILLFQYALPAAAVMALHLLICRFLSTRERLRADSARSQQQMSRHRKNLVLLTVICVTFDVQWLPITAVNILADIDHTLFPSAASFSLTYALCLLFALTSVFVNPVLYGCYNSNFRRDWRSRSSRLTSTSGSTVRRSSGLLTRLYSTAMGSSVVSRLHSSPDSTVTGGQMERKAGRARRQHGSLDAAAHSFRCVQRPEVQGRSMSLQYELK